MHLSSQPSSKEGFCGEGVTLLYQEGLGRCGAPKSPRLAPWRLGLEECLGPVSIWGGGMF